MSDMTEEYDVPTKDQMLAFAERIGSDDAGDLLEFEFHQYSEDINDVLLEMREGMEYSNEIKEELSDLYDDWKSNGFPIEEVDYDALQEGGPEEKSRAETEGEEDLDAEPDPEDL